MGMTKWIRLQNNIINTAYGINSVCGRLVCNIFWKIEYLQWAIIRNLNRLSISASVKLAGKRVDDNTVRCDRCGLPIIGTRFWINPDNTRHKLPFAVYTDLEGRYRFLNLDGTMRIKEQYFTPSRSEELWNVLMNTPSETAEYVKICERILNNSITLYDLPESRPIPKGDDWR